MCPSCQSRAFLGSMKAQTSGIARQATGSDAAEQPAGWSGEDSGWSGATGAGATVLQRLGSAVSKVPQPMSPLLRSVDGRLPGNPGRLLGPPTLLLNLCCRTEELGARGYEGRAAEAGQGADHLYRQRLSSQLRPALSYQHRLQDEEDRQYTDDKQGWHRGSPRDSQDAVLASELVDRLGSCTSSSSYADCFDTAQPQQRAGDGLHTCSSRLGYGSTSALAIPDDGPLSGLPMLPADTAGEVNSPCSLADLLDIARHAI